VKDLLYGSKFIETQWQRSHYHNAVACGFTRLTVRSIYAESLDAVITEPNPHATALWY